MTETTKKRDGSNGKWRNVMGTQVQLDTPAVSAASPAMTPSSSDLPTSSWPSPEALQDLETRARTAIASLPDDVGEDDRPSRPSHRGLRWDR